MGLVNGVCTVEYGNVGMVIGVERFVVEVEAAVDAINIWLMAAFDLRVRGVFTFACASPRWTECLFERSRFDGFTIVRRLV